MKCDRKINSRAKSPHAVSAQNSERVESMRAVCDDSTDMIGRRQAIDDGGAEDLERRNAGYTSYWWRCSNQTLSSFIHRNDFCRLFSVLRQSVLEVSTSQHGQSQWTATLRSLLG